MWAEDSRLIHSHLDPPAPAPVHGRIAGRRALTLTVIICLIGLALAVGSAVPNL